MRDELSNNLDNLYIFIYYVIIFSMNKKKKIVCFSFLGTTLDQGHGQDRWTRWRPNVALVQNEDLIIDELVIIYQRRYSALANTILEDIGSVSPETKVTLKRMEFRDPWDFPSVFAALMDFAKGYAFDTEKFEYLIHITTGSHVTQICEFLLTESRYFPAKLIQTSPPKRKNKEFIGSYTIIDLDLSKYDQIATRFATEQIESLSFLKAGIETRNKKFNSLIEEIEKVAIHSTEPFLLMGPTGAGKSSLAKRIYELKKKRNQVDGPFIEVNCATIKGEMAMSSLFGHIKGAFTGALKDRAGLLREANGGILFLDEIGELGLDEQAMLLKAIEEKIFLPVGADQPVSSDFLLIAGTNRDLHHRAATHKFREDLLTRINLWTFYMPALKDRLEDIEPNIEYELQKFAKTHNKRITLNKEARDAFLRFSRSADALWSANFRDLNAAMTRMCTLASQGRITVNIVSDEIKRLRHSWQSSRSDDPSYYLAPIIGQQSIEELDLIERVQLAFVIRTCRESATLSDAGRKLFAASRQKKRNANDADRLRKYLLKYRLDWRSIVELP